MKIKTSELTGPALDWAVAKCEGKLPLSYDDWVQTWPRYSTNWAQGGPIIEREKMTTEWESHDIPPEKGDWVATIYNRAAGHTQCSGPTPLIAAMRCLCASKLGDEVEVPDELA